MSKDSSSPMPLAESTARKVGILTWTMHAWEKILPIDIEGLRHCLVTLSQRGYLSILSQIHNSHNKCFPVIVRVTKDMGMQRKSKS